jgi:serine/threonine-protein kinase
MFTLLTGKLVRDAETLTEQLALAIHEPAPKLASVDKTIDPAVCALVDKALAYEKKQRFADARAMQREVRRVLQLVPPSLTIGVTPSPASPRPSRVSPDQPTLLESGRVVAAEPRESKPITIAIERRVATALLIGGLVAAAFVLWLFRGSSPPAPKPEESSIRGGALAPASPGAAEAKGADPSDVRALSATGEPSPPVVTSSRISSPRGTAVAPRALTAPASRPTASSSSSAVTAPPAVPAPAPAKSSDPFSSRY